MKHLTIFFIFSLFLTPVSRAEDYARFAQLCQQLGGEFNANAVAYIVDGETPEVARCRLTTEVYDSYRRRRRYYDTLPDKNVLELRAACPSGKLYFSAQGFPELTEKNGKTYVVAPHHLIVICPKF